MDLWHPSWALCDSAVCSSSPCHRQLYSFLGGLRREKEEAEEGVLGEWEEAWEEGERGEGFLVMKTL